MTAELSAGLLQPSAALDELAWIAADARRAGSGLAARVTGAVPRLNSLDAEASLRPSTRSLRGVVGPWRNAGYWNPVSSGAVGGTVAPVGYAGPRRSLNVGVGYLGDGTFPGY